MHSNNKRKYGDNTAPGGGTMDLTKVDQKRIDDFRERIKRQEEERKRSHSSGQGSSQSYSHN